MCRTSGDVKFVMSKVGYCVGAVGSTLGFAEGIYVEGRLVGEMLLGRVVGLVGPKVGSSLGVMVGGSVGLSVGIFVLGMHPSNPSWN